MKTYKVWIEVEEVDDDEGYCENIGLPVSVGGEMTEEAFELQSKLEEYLV